MAKHCVSVKIDMCILIFHLLLNIHSSYSSDPSPLQDFCVADTTKSSSSSSAGLPCKDPTKVVASDFKSSLLGKAGNTSNALGSILTIGTASSFPGLNTQGLSVGRIDYAIGGMVQPHYHPRASEVLYVVKGTLYAGFIDTQNRLFAERVAAGEMFVFPRGMVHFIQNVGNGAAVSLSSLNSQNPGAVLVAKTVFASKPAAPDNVLATAFKISVREVHSIETALFRAG